MGGLATATEYTCERIQCGMAKRRKRERDRAEEGEQRRSARRAWSLRAEER